MKQITVGGFTVVTDNASENWDDMLKVLKKMIELHNNITEVDEQTLQKMLKQIQQGGSEK